MNETIKRLITAFILAFLFIFAVTIDEYIFTYKISLLVFILYFAYIGILEVHRCGEQSLKLKLNFIQDIIIAFTTIIWIYIYSLQQYQNNFNIAYPTTLQMILDQCNVSPESLLILFYLFIVVFFAGKNVFKSPLPNAFIPFAISTFILLYFVIPLTHLLLLSTIPYSIFYIGMTVWSTAMVDSAAYFCGKFLGKHKIGFALSPNKTYEGYIGGFIGQVILTYAIYYVFKSVMPVPIMSYLQIFLFCILIYILSVLGDLAGSLIKRNLGVKDFGNSIPGHGGVIDLLDALMLTVPACYYFHSFFVSN